jgi:hypothetical protein
LCAAGEASFITVKIMFVHARPRAALCENYTKLGSTISMRRVRLMRICSVSDLS